MYTCRECEREINQATEVCPHCGTDLSTPAAEAVAPEKKPTLAKSIIRYAIVLAAMWGFLWYVLPERHGGDAAREAESRAMAALHSARSALMAYAGAQQGVFPESLEGLPGETFATVREAAQAAQREGYRLEYSATPEGSEGRLRHFVLLARPGNYGYRNFFVDETGVIRATREDRPATVQDPPM